MINLWKLITEPKVLVEKICNECGKVIETFDSTHPLTQYMIFDLQAHNPDKKVNLDALDFGLQPYHWCPITKTNPHCLVPMATITRELCEQQQEQQVEKKEDTEKIFGFAPYKAPTTTTPHKSHNKGRPPSTVLKAIRDLEEKREGEKKDNDSTNSI